LLPNIFVYRGIKLFNNLPYTVKTIQNKSWFKYEIKKKLYAAISLNGLINYYNCYESSVMPFENIINLLWAP